MPLETKPKFSIITPVFREAEVIDSYFQMIGRLYRSHLTEVIVVDGDRGSTVAEFDESTHRFRLVTASPSRGGQLLAGARYASSDYLIFVHVDTKLPRMALTWVETALAKHEAGAFQLSIESENPAIRAVMHIANFRNKFTRTPYGDQVHFFRRSFYERIGGYRNIPIMEDVEIMRRIKRSGGKICMVQNPVITSDRRWQKEGVLRGTLRNWTNLLMYRIGVPVDHIARRYRPHSDE